MDIPNGSVKVSFNIPKGVTVYRQRIADLDNESTRNAPNRKLGKLLVEQPLRTVMRQVGDLWGLMGLINYKQGRFKISCILLGLHGQWCEGQMQKN